MHKAQCHPAFHVQIYTQDGQQVIYDANGISLDGPSGRRLLGWWSSAVSWVSKNVVKPIEKAVVKPIVNIANQIAAGATDAWNKTENWVTDAANTVRYGPALALLQAPSFLL